MTTGRKLAIGGTLVVGVTVCMACLGGATSWQYYLTVDECLADLDEHLGDWVRVSGKVAAGSLEIAADQNSVKFQLEGPESSRGVLPVVCRGPLPDNLAEKVDVVVEGRFETTGLLRGDKVLTRCAGKYDPGEHVARGDRDSQTDVEAAR